jgi:rod shape determining protein RodA
MALLDKRYIKYFDLTSFFLVLTLSTIGLMFVLSATYRPDLPYSIFFKKQLFGMSSGIIIFFLCCTIDYRKAIRWGFFGYIAVIALLAFTFLKGSIGGWGAQRWIDLAFIKIQPSEIAKLFFPAFTTYYFYTYRDYFTGTWRDYVPIVIPLAISTVLVLKQPDLGTAIVLFASALMMLWLTGISKKFFIYFGLISILGAPIFWHLLKPYQKARIMVFLGQGTTTKERYQIEQAKIAIGSGGITGKGFLQGTQNKLHFIPAGQTDCIFAVLCEEAGLIGALLVLGLYIMLFLRLFSIVQTIKPPDPKLFAAGLVMPIMISAFINICMVLGLLPVVGIPLPFMTYGISHTWTTFASLGFFMGIAIRRCYING